LIFAKNGTGKSTISYSLYLISKLQEKLQEEPHINNEELFKKLRPLHKDWGDSKIEIEFKFSSQLLMIEFNDDKIINMSGSSEYQKSPKLHIYCDDFLNTLNPNFSKSGALNNMVEVNITEDDNELKNKQNELTKTEKTLNDFLGKTESGEDDEEKGFTKDLKEIYDSLEGKPKQYWDKIKNQIYGGNTDGLVTENSSDIQKKLEKLNEISVDSIEIKSRMK